MGTLVRAHPVIRKRLNADFFDNFLGCFIRITPQKSPYFRQFLKKIVLGINGLSVSWVMSD